MAPMIPRPCLRCGTPSDGSYCPEHRPPDHEQSSTERGYDYRWSKLSKRARAMVDWCEDCGSREDLTADHLRWPARSLSDVAIVCRRCNSRRGARRSTRGVTHSDNSHRPALSPAAGILTAPDRPESNEKPLQRRLRASEPPV